jgi:alkanesulfonate monooxygenase SsuD/methylene tetrahydromethanopterin reductase-like flavin-dependent oxidoreductase (luciferase family)
MPTPDVPLEKLGFLTIGTFDGDDPAPGHENVLEVIELGEQLGFDSVYLRHRHFQTGISSPIAIMAAASQRTRRIAMGTAVTPLGWENPLRLAEDLATVDILSGGRLQPGFSIGPPIHWDDFATIQQRQIALFRQHHPDGAAARVSQGLVVIPTDTATSLGPALGWKPAV